MKIFKKIIGWTIIIMFFFTITYVPLYIAFGDIKQTLIKGSLTIIGALIATAIVMFGAKLIVD